MLPLSPSQCLADASSTVCLPDGSLASVLSSKSSSFYVRAFERQRRAVDDDGEAAARSHFLRCDRDAAFFAVVLLAG